MWQQLFEDAVLVLMHFAAAVTASTLAALGHTELSRRFGQWILDNDPGGRSELFVAELDEAGLSDLEPSGVPERIDDLLAALHVLASRSPR